MLYILCKDLSVKGGDQGNIRQKKMYNAETMYSHVPNPLTQQRAEMVSELRCLRTQKEEE